MAKMNIVDVWLRRALPLLTLALIATLLGGDVSQAQEMEPPSDIFVDEPACERPPEAAPTPLPAGSIVDREDFNPSMKWLGNHEVQAALERVQDVIDAVPDSVLGSYVNYSDHALVVVFNPGIPPSDEIGSALQAAAGSELAVEIRPGCRSGHTLQEVESELAARRWHESAHDIAFAFSIDAAASRVVVTLPPEADAAAAKLDDMFGDRVAIRFDEVARLSRTSDASPHYGGARINYGYQSGHCSTAFAADTHSGRWMVSAGHCADGENEYFFSASEYYGKSLNRFFPAPDLMLLGSSGETYSRSMHIDPLSPSVRTINAIKESYMGMAICANGSFTRAICGAAIADNDTTFCDPAGCTYDLYYAERPGVNIVQGGDSGGAAFGRQGDYSADARGVIVAGRSTGGDYGYFHKVSTVESILGVDIATSGAATTSF